MAYPKDQIYEVLTFAVGKPVVWRDFNAPRPPKPYCTVAFGQHNPMDFSSRREVTAEGMQDHVKNVTSTLEVTYYGDEAYMRLLDASARLGFTGAVDRCVRGNISIGQLVSLNNAPMAVDKLQYEERAVMEVQVNWVTILTDEPGLIEQVVIGGTDTGGATEGISCVGVVTSP